MKPEDIARGKGKLVLREASHVRHCDESPGTRAVNIENV